MCGCDVSRRYIDVCYCNMFSVVNVYLDHLKFCVVCIMVEGMSVVVNVMLSLMSVMSPSSSSLSCHQTILFHSSVHCFPTSLNIIRSSQDPGCASWEHRNMCAVVSSAFPQAHVVSPV